MAGYKVEICGVNTSKLPLLTNEEKTTFSDGSRMEIRTQEKYILKEI